MKQRQGAIDLAKVREARAKLRAIVKRHPHLVGESSAENRKAWALTLQKQEEKDKEAMARPPGPEPTLPLAVRMGESIIDALDRYRDKLTKEIPGFTITRNDAIRRLLMLGLEREGVHVHTPTRAKKSKAKG